MSERTTGNPNRVWRPMGPDVAAGYQQDELGYWTILGLVVYGPTTEKLRGTSLRALERIEMPTLHDFVQPDPPGPEALVARWAAKQQHMDVVIRPLEQRYSHWVEQQIAEAATPEQLKRRGTDAPGDFYARVARAHALLALVSKRPTVELARRAGVPVGTAAAWVSRARSHGAFEGVFGGEEGDQS